MKVIFKSKIKGCFLLEHNNFKDERGNFAKVFSDQFTKKYLNKKRIKQINYSTTKKKYSLRGLHYQNPYSEFKLVKCLEGKIFDVVVDLRKKSKTFMRTQTFLLEFNKPQILLIPENCAHGFQTLESNCKILYLHTNNYFPQFSQGFHYKDPSFNINWPSKPTNISKKDSSYKFIDRLKYRGL